MTRLETHMIKLRDERIIELEAEIDRIDQDRSNLLCRLQQIADLGDCLGDGGYYCEPKSCPFCIAREGLNVWTK